MKAIKTDKAPKALGPYSQAILTGSNLYISGQIAINPETGMMVTDTIEAETEQIMNNIEAILEEARLNFTFVVKTTIFVTDIQYFDAVNGIYAKYFKENPPARSFVQVANLPKGAHVEIETIAVR